MIDYVAVPAFLPYSVWYANKPIGELARALLRFKRPTPRHQYRLSRLLAIFTWE